MSRAHSDLLRQVKDALEWDDWQVEPIQGVYNRKGIWDLYADRSNRGRPRVIWLEIKTGKGELSRAQIDFASRRRRSEVECYVIRKIEDLERLCILSEKVRIGE